MASTQVQHGSRLRDHVNVEMKDTGALSRWGDRGCFDSSLSVYRGSQKEAVAEAVSHTCASQHFPDLSLQVELEN